MSGSSRRDDWGNGLLCKPILSNHSAATRAGDRTATATSRRRAQSTGTKASRLDKADASERTRYVAGQRSGGQTTPLKRGSSVASSRSRSVPGKRDASSVASGEGRALTSHLRNSSPAAASASRPGAAGRATSPRPGTARSHSRRSESHEQPRPARTSAAAARASAAAAASSGGGGGGGGSGGSTAAEWRHHRTAAGKVYYWNTRTRETKWTLPSPLRAQRVRSPEEIAETREKIKNATPQMHAASTRIQGLVKMREARLEVRRRKQERSKAEAASAKRASPVPSAISKLNAGSAKTSAPATAKYTRAHSHDVRKPASSATGRSSSSAKTRESLSRSGSALGKRTAATPRAASPVAGGSGGLEKFRRSTSHSTAGTKSSGAAAAPRDAVRRSTSHGGRAAATRTPRRAPSAPTPATRSASLPRKRFDPVSPPKTPTTKGLQIPTTLDDPRYQEGGYLSVAAGHKLGARYELLLLLGTGQSATVWLAADTQTQGQGPHQYVAIKITKCCKTVRCSSLHEVALLYHIAKRSTVRKRGHETGSALLIGHFEQAGKFGRHVCMVFEVLGQTLDVLMVKTNFQGIGDLSAIKDLTISILMGLDELAAMNVVHTDLKPENIMFSRPSVDARKAVATYINTKADTSGIVESAEDERSVKISDFGLSYLLRPKNDKHINGEPLSSSDLQLIFASNYTKGAIIQTREYRAPEIILGNDFCTETDIWSLACIVYELVTGLFLFDPKTQPSVVDETTMDMEHLAEIHSVLGAPAKEVTTCGGVYSENYYDQVSGKQLFQDSTADIHADKSISDAVHACTPVATEAAAATKQLTHFVKSALTWDPVDRPSAADLLHHPWLKERFAELHPGRDTACEATRTWDV